MKIQKRTKEIIDVIIKDNKIINLKSDDRLFFTCIQCQKETSKTASSYSKKNIDYHQLDTTKKDYFLCSSCSSKFYTKERIGVENNMLNESIKNKNIKSRKENFDKVEFIINEYSDDYIKIIKGKNSSDIIEFKCSECGKIESKQRRSITTDLLCRECKIKKTDRNISYELLKEKFENKVSFLFDKEEYVGQRQGKNINYKFKCKKCEKEFNDHLHSNVPRCPFCYPKYTSIGEKEIAEFLKENSINIIEKDRNIIPPYELDIYMPEKQLAIEFNGLYWHSELNGKNKKYHLNKMKLCEKKGIRLIHIFEDEWIYKSNIVKSIILNKLGISDKKIGARKTLVKEIDNKTAFEFYEKNHIQGGINSKINIGLFYENELISSLSISNGRFEKNKLEITRFANRIGYNVMGAFSKLLKNIKLEKPLISYADLRYFDGKVYEKNKFILSHISEPNYYYLDNNYNKRMNRIKFQKHKLEKELKNFDKNLTEWENMLNNGYDRIWDCGNLVYAMNISK